MKKPIEVKKKLKKVTEYTACFAFLMFLQGVGAPMVFADATAAINAKFEILWNLISAVVQSVGGVILLWHAFEFGASMHGGCSGNYNCSEGIMKREGISSFFLWRKYDK